jgi:nucleoside-diphosphate-sugar epimerase
MTTQKRVLFFGGTGYIGKCLVSEFIRSGYNVTVVTRRPDEADMKDCIFVQGNALDQELMHRIVDGYDIVVHLAAIIRSHHKKLFLENSVFLSNVLEAMAKNGIPRILYFSTQNVLLNNTGPYGNSKKKSEQILKAGNIDYMILRPSITYGIDTKNDFYHLASIMKKSHICPIIGSGKWRLCPVNKYDLADTAIKCVENWQSRAELNVSGNQIVTMNTVVQTLEEYLRIRCFKFNVPLSLLRLIKLALPFDVDGLDEDRVAEEDVMTGKSEFWNDLRAIAGLVCSP